MRLTERQLTLLEFVKEQHGEQKRKYTHEPYWEHPYAVAKLIQPYITDEGFLQTEIALCHDLFEDTECDISSLSQFLKANGYSVDEARDIAFGTHYLTDKYTRENFPQFNRAERKRFEAIRLGSVPGHIQTVKYADLIENTSSIVIHDPGFAKTYLDEKKELLKLMRDGDFDLYLEAIRFYHEGLKTIYGS